MVSKLIGTQIKSIRADFQPKYTLHLINLGAQIVWSIQMTLAENSKRNCPKSKGIFQKYFFFDISPWK